MRNKNGFAHFEMVISFIFFMGFIFFLFMYISPWTSSSLPSSALSQLYNSFTQNVNTNLSTVFIKTNYTGNASCFYINLPKSLFKYSITDGNSLVTKLGGIRISSSLNGNSLNLDKSSNFFRVAISPEFSNSALSSCVVLKNFELGKVIELQVVSYSKLLSMRNKYYSNYNGLKKDLKISGIFDFAVVPEGMPEIKMMPKKGIPDSVNVLAKDYVVKVLRSDGAISNERISIRIW